MSQINLILFSRNLSLDEDTMDESENTCISSASPRPAKVKSIPVNAHTAKFMKRVSVKYFSRYEI